MSETPMNKLRELCEKWEREAIGNGEDIYDDGDLRRCAYELRAILPEVERLVDFCSVCEDKKDHFHATEREDALIKVAIEMGAAWSNSWAERHGLMRPIPANVRERAKETGRRGARK